MNEERTGKCLRQVEHIVVICDTDTLYLLQTLGSVIYKLYRNVLTIPTVWVLIVLLFLFVLSASRTKQSLDDFQDNYPTINICTLDAQRDDDELNDLVRDSDIVVGYFLLYILIYLTPPQFVPVPNQDLHFQLFLKVQGIEDFFVLLTITV